MPAPVIAAAVPAIKPVVEKTIDRLNHPVIGIRRTVTVKRKSRETTTTYSAEVRGWELILMGVAGLGFYALMTGSLDRFIPGSKDNGTGGLKSPVFDPRDPMSFFYTFPLLSPFAAGGVSLARGMGLVPTIPNPALPGVKLPSLPSLPLPNIPIPNPFGYRGA